jgi:hypothetical protein
MADRAEVSPATKNISREVIPESVTRRLEIFHSFQDRTPATEPHPGQIKRLSLNSSHSDGAVKILISLSASPLHKKSFLPALLTPSSLRPWMVI